METDTKAAAGTGDPKGAGSVHRFVGLFREWQNRRRIEKIRKMFAEWGHDTSSMSDDDFEKALMAGLYKIGAAARDAGVSISQAADNLARLAKLANK